VRAAIGVDMTCQSGSFGYDDGYFKVAITKSGAFKASFANQLVDDGQGRFSLWSGKSKAGSTAPGPGSPAHGMSTTPIATR
jgi:hypothetical protein